MLTELLTLPLRQNMKDIFKNITGYTLIFIQRHLNRSQKYGLIHIQNYNLPYTDSLLKLSMKSAEISRGMRALKPIRRISYFMDEYISGNLWQVV